VGASRYYWTVLTHDPGLLFLRALARALGRRYTVERAGKAHPQMPLQTVMTLGLRTVFDIGASQGEWTVGHQRWFPDARFLLVEPLEEWRPALERLGHDFVIAAASDQPGHTTLNVHADLYGSSLLNEREPGIDGRPRKVAAVTLDHLAEGRPGPFAIKVDVQGAELRVLDGGKAALSQAELVVLETSLFRSMRGGPVFHEVIAYMARRGFVPYGFLDFIHRPLDGALAQADVIFVKRNGPLWAEHTFATPEQRAAQNADYAVRLTGELSRKESEPDGKRSVI
jgi:FkbM family methyltransferase